MFKAKKYLSLILSTLVLFTTIPSLSVQAYERKSSGVVHSYSLSSPSESGYADDSFSVPSIESTGTQAPENYIPNSFDVRDYYVIPSVKDQLNTGACWAFAAASAGEISLIANNGYDADDIDLSELHLSYFTYNDAYDRLGFLKGDSIKTYDNFLASGGLHRTTVLSLARWTGFLNEKDHEEFDFENASSDFTVYDNEKAYMYNEAILENALWISYKDNLAIKENLMTYGAAIIGYYHNDKFLNRSNGSYCFIQNFDASNPGFMAPNHEACIVGWDDNYPKSNFSSTSRPSRNGAWLVKNSWGPNYGDNGYIWISYEDSSLQNEDACFMGFTSSKRFDYNYQYDGSCNPTANFSDGTDMTNGGYTGGGYMANVFTAQHSDYLNAVSFVTYDTNVNYSIEIYTGLTNKKNPTSGTKALKTAITGTKTYAGYYTVTLPESVPLTQGDRFSVIVRLYKDNPSQRVILPCDASGKMSWVEYTNTAISNQSFFSTDSFFWSNVAYDNSINFRIKAFTSHLRVDESYDQDYSVEDIVLDQDNISLMEQNSMVLQATVFPENATNKKVVWTSSNSNVARVTSAGRVVAVKKGKAVITATTVDGGYTASCTVDVKPYEFSDPILWTSVNEGTLEIWDALTAADGETITVIGQVAYRYGKNKENIVIQDIYNGDVYGMLIYDENSLFNYVEGQIIEVTGKFMVFKGLRELKEIESVRLVSYKEPIPPQKLTISQLRSKPNDYISEYILIENALVNNYTSSGNTPVTDNTGDIDIFDAARYPDDVKDGDVVDLYCVFSVYDTTYQLRTSDPSAYAVFADGIDDNTDTEPSSDNEYIYFGDVTCDGEVKMDDVTYIQKSLALLVNLNEVENFAADVTADNTVNLVDVVDIQKYIAKLIPDFVAGISTKNPFLTDLEEATAIIRELIKELFDHFNENAFLYFNNSDGFYTEESYATFVDAYNLAVELYNNENSTVDELQYAHDYLTEAFYGLEYGCFDDEIDWDDYYS